MKHTPQDEEECSLLRSELREASRLYRRKFMWFLNEDECVKPENAVAVAEALKKGSRASFIAAKRIEEIIKVSRVGK